MQEKLQNNRFGQLQKSIRKGKLSRRRSNSGVYGQQCVAAATAASTFVAGAFIGSATVYGMAVVTAASTSSSIKEFNNQGNWGTVAATAGGAILGGGSAYVFPFWCLDEYEQE